MRPLLSVQSVRDRPKTIVFRRELTAPILGVPMTFAQSVETHSMALKNVQYHSGKVKWMELLVARRVRRTCEGYDPCGQCHLLCSALLVTAYICILYPDTCTYCVQHGKSQHIFVYCIQIPVPTVFSMVSHSIYLYTVSRYLCLLCSAWLVTAYYTNMDL